MPLKPPSTGRLGAGEEGMPMSRTIRSSARRLWVLAPLAALACATLGGCASASPAPSVSFPSASALPTLDLNQSPDEGTSSVPQSVSKAVSALVEYTAGAAVRKYEAGWVVFTVVISNSSSADIPDVVPLVVFGSCTCDPASGGVPPRSILQVYNATTNAWGSSASVSVNAAGHYAFEHQVTQETLPANQSLRYQYRVALSGAETGMQDGTGSIEVYIMQQPGHKRITYTAGPDASTPLPYDVN
jgi:hypothetical protein